MLGLIFDAAVRIVTELVAGRVDKALREKPVTPPDPRRVLAARGAYERWVARRGLRRDESGRGFRGALGRHPVVLRPGLEGSAPIGVEVEIEIAHGATRQVLLTPSSRGEGPLEGALAACFDDHELPSALRSIAVTSSGLRLRFAALTRPEIVELGVPRAIEARLCEPLSRSGRRRPQATRHRRTIRRRSKSSNGGRRRCPNEASSICQRSSCLPMAIRTTS